MCMYVCMCFSVLSYQVRYTNKVYKCVYMYIKRHKTQTCLSNFKLSRAHCRPTYRYMYICTHKHTHTHMYTFIPSYTHTHMYTFIPSYTHTYRLSDEVDHSEKKAAAVGRAGFVDEVPGGGGAKAATGSTRGADEEEQEVAGPGATIPMVDVSDVKKFVMSASFFSFSFPPFFLIFFSFLSRALPRSCAPPSILN